MTELTKRTIRLRSTGPAFDGIILITSALSYASQSNAEIFTDFLDAFIEEGSAEVEKLENEVGEWEKNVTSEPLFAEVSRTLHTIKGIAKGVGLQRLGTLVHNFETLLDKLPRPKSARNRTISGSSIPGSMPWCGGVGVVDKRADVASELPEQGGEVAALQQEAQSIVSPQADVVELRHSAPRIEPWRAEIDSGFSAG